jgi:hypothetical protein
MPLPRSLLCLSLVPLLACGSDGGGGVDAGPVTETRPGCDDATFLATPTDPAVDGPWLVGARTVQVGRLTTEVWYPAPYGSAAGQTPVRYDIREALNPSQRTLIPDADNPWQDCDCYRDLPLDEAHGPYPVVVFVHGTAAFRHQSLTMMTHWASRGFVVVAADHPGLMLGDLLANLCPDDPSGEQDLSGDIDALLAALAAPAGDLAFLAGRIDPTRVAITGHSAGGNASAEASTKPNVRVVMPLAASAAATDTDALQSVLYMGGLADGIVGYDDTTTAWTSSPAPRRLVGLTNTGHLFCSDLCDTRNAAGKNLLEIASDYNLCGSAFAGILFDCNEAYLEGDRGREIVEAATSTVLETTLQCRTDLGEVSALQDRYAEIGDYQEAL